MEVVNNLKKQTLSGLFWKFAERMGAQIVTFLVSLVLARLLLPEDYGAVAIIMTFITLADCLVVNGFGSALIQKEDADHIDFSSVFYFNIFFSLLIYAFLFLAAPYITAYFKQPVLCATLRVLALRVPIAGINSVQHAYVSRTMQFRRFFFSTLGGTIAAAVIGIIMAYLGCGIWALVAQYLVNACVDTLVLWITVGWRPQLSFSLKRLKGLFQYGWKILLSGILDTGNGSLYNIIIGKKYNSAMLAYYNNGYQIPYLVVNNINTSISSVMFPVLSREQREPEKVKEHTRRAVQISSYVIWPMMLGMATCAEPLIRIFLTEKWTPAVFYLQAACISYGLLPVHTSHLEALKAMGRSDWFLRLEVVKQLIGIIVLLFTMRISVKAIAVGDIAVGVMAAFINAWPNKKLIHYSYIELLKDILPSFLLSSVMAILVLYIGGRISNDYLSLIIQIIVGVAVYLAESVVFKINSFYYILETAKQFLVKRTKG